MTQTATTITVDSLPIASTIDPVQDRVLIYTASATDIQGISRNVYLGLSSQPVGLTDSQTLSTKVLDNTNILTIKDTNLTIQDDSDTTKQLKFQLSGITTATTRTLTIPDASDTVVGIAATQTLTNKTLTAPIISGGTIDQTAITVDSIAGHTTANTGSIYGLAVTTGTIAAAGIASNAVTYTKLLSTIFSGQISTQANAGTAGGTFSYVNLGGIKLLWITGASVASSAAGPAYTFTLPVGFFSTITAAVTTAQNATVTNNQYIPITGAPSTVTISIAAYSPSGAATIAASMFVVGT